MKLPSSWSPTTPLMHDSWFCARHPSLPWSYLSAERQRGLKNDVMVACKWFAIFLGIGWGLEILFSWAWLTRFMPVATCLGFLMVFLRIYGEASAALREQVGEPWDGRAAFYQHAQAWAAEMSKFALSRDVEKPSLERKVRRARL